MPGTIFSALPTFRQCSIKAKTAFIIISQENNVKRILGIEKNLMADSWNRWLQHNPNSSSTCLVSQMRIIRKYNTL